ncbi:DUF6281 family protein [Streptomyces sp. CRN 30]|uniref:DUF6281 family protein n=1 Tax=Streptomyces sp. CRN 30 TaxID=3075613 RepID=UPI002A817F2B|nr:DUF6281 family protein [Streptomyces sp. CRN 30]
MRRHTHTLTALAAVAAAVLTATACTASGGGGGEAAASCAITATYGGRTYTDATGPDFTLGAALGTAEFPPCLDTPNDPDTTPAHEPTTAYAVVGSDPREAIAVRWDDDELMLLTADPGPDSEDGTAE